MNKHVNYQNVHVISRAASAIMHLSAIHVIMIIMLVSIPASARGLTKSCSRMMLDSDIHQDWKPIASPSHHAPQNTIGTDDVPFLFHIYHVQYICIYTSYYNYIYQFRVSLPMPFAIFVHMLSPASHSDFSLIHKLYRLVAQGSNKSM